MQRSLWASQLNHPDQPVQNMPLLSKLHGPIDPERLATAFDSVVCDSDVLRTRLVDNPAANARAGTGSGRWQVELLKLGTQPRSEIVDVASADVESWARARGAKTIDLTVCGYDSAIAVHEDGSLSWYLNLHHVITDATSSALVFDATASAYSARSGLPDASGLQEPSDPPAATGLATGSDRAESTSYYRWARALAAHLDDPADASTSRAIDYWQQRSPANRIGRLYEAADQITTAAERLSLPVGPELLRVTEERLGSDYRMLTEDLAWSTLLTTTTALYLHRVTGAQRFAIGLPVHNRSKPITRSLIGPTMEVFPVDIEIDPDDSFRSLHKRIGRSILNTLRYAMPGTSPAPDFEAVVNVIPRATQRWFGPTAATTKWLHSGSIDGSHLLRVQMTAYATGAEQAAESQQPSATESAPEFALDINHGAAQPDQRLRASGHIVGLLSEIVSDPDAAIGGTSLCLPDEIDLLRRWETTPAPATAAVDVFDRLEAALAGNDATVLTQPADSADDADAAFDRVVTGAELWQHTIGVANHLQSHGIGRGDRVAVLLPRSIEAVVAIYGVMAAGASFVPLDPSQPKARTDRLAERAGCVTVLSSVAEIAALRSPTAKQVAGFKPVDRASTDEAYLLFTSGSTGEPKGVPITSGALADYIRFAEASYGHSSAEHSRLERSKTAKSIDGSQITAALFSPLTFDLTITSLFMPIVAGGRLVVIEPDGPAGLSIIAKRPEINWCKATPSHLEILVRLLSDDHGLSTLVVGGEAFGSRLAAQLLAFNPTLTIFNEYGPTEAVVGCMIYELEPELLDDQSDVPIGRPAPGVTLMVVDEYLQRVPIGSPGELCIAHPGLTSGYLHPKGDEPDPFVIIDGQRFYRSGDLVRLQDSERLVYLGRRDAQIKVGGIRLEPIEVEDRLNAHPNIERSAVRLWSPQTTTPANHCLRCGLPDNIPGVGFDDSGICETCDSFDRVAPIAQSWFKTPEDLQAKLAKARAVSTGQYDCVHLLSGGKDSTYALYQLVELGFRPYALTLDNGFISEGAKENVRRSVADLGIDHEFATSESMNAIFRDSLDRYSNVCHGCYKTIYTLATNRAAEIGAPFIVTGLSRGQLFETRLIPQQFSVERFDPDAIDRAVIEARKLYHRVDDGPNRLLDNKIFAEDELFERIEYLDIYRYLDVELATMLNFLEERAPWVRPSDTGRSTNCLINAAGIHTHQTEQGYHNYAVPYAWDVRLGHKTRQEAIEELDDRLDLDEVETMLAEVGYQPRPREILTAWIQTKSSEEQAGSDTELGSHPQPSAAELRSFLAESLPAHAIPAAFVEVDDLPLSANGKLDDAALPAPKRVHRPGPTLQLSAEAVAERATLSELQLLVIELWEQILQTEPITLDDDFFALGGDSLAALEMIVALGDRCDRALGEDLAFTNTTPAQLVAAIELLDTEQLDAKQTDENPGDNRNQATNLGDPLAFAAANKPDDAAPTLSPGELAVLFEQANRPDEVMYNVGRLYIVAGSVEPDRFEQALRTAAGRHQPLCWSYASPRRPLDSQQAVSFQISSSPVASEDLDQRCAELHRAPFDLADGPLLRCVMQPIDDGSTAIMLVIHHASGDAGSFTRLWNQINDELAGADPAELPIGYAEFSEWQSQHLGDDHRRYWLDQSSEAPAARLSIHQPDESEPDGFLTTTASITADQLRSGTTASAASVALGAVAATVRCFSDGPAVELGLITSTRSHQAAENLFGYFLNTVPVQIDCSDQLSFAAIARQSSQAIGGALAHRSYPLAKIIADRQDAGRPLPNLDVFMAFDELDSIDLEGSITEQRVLSNGDAVAPLTFFVEIRDNRVELSLEYRGSVIGSAVANEMLATFDALLNQAITSPARSLGEIAADHPTTNRRSSLMIASPSYGSGRENEPVIATIARHLKTGGQSPAVVCGNDQLSWSQTAERAAAITQALASAGVGRGDRVLLCLERSVNLVPAILGIQLTGAAYVPIDPSYPESRISLIAAKAGATVGVVGAAHQALVEEPIVVDEETLDGTLWSAVGDGSGFGPATALEPAADLAHQDPCYLIFTSGSTGEPRGVAVSHANLAASTGARAEVYGQPPERFLMLSSVAFDSSIVGLFWTLAAGGTVVLPTEAEAHDLGAIVKLLRTGVSHTLMVPTLYQGLVGLVAGGREVTNGAAGGWAEHVIVAGETCPPALLSAHFAAFPESHLTNEYGPTEATVWATAHHCGPSDSPVPIGPPVPGSWLAVVDQTGAIRPAGVEGELIIGGLGVVDGYLDDPSETARRFRQLPQRLQPPALRDHANVGDGRYFLTGDRAVVVGGELRFLGRGDGQLNVGGARVEPEEIEAVLLGSESITGAVVVAADMRSSDQLLESLPNDVVGRAMAAAAKAEDPHQQLLIELRAHGKPDVRLVAHVEGPPTVEVAALRALAATGLPPLLRPVHYGVHHQLPTTPNGKLDRQAAARLPVLDTESPPTVQIPAALAADKDPSETALLTESITRLMADALRKPSFGPDDSFFDEGGHSLLAMELLLSIEDLHKQRLPAAALYDAPTPAMLAAKLSADRAERGVTQQTRSFLVPIQKQGSRPPIFAVHVLGVDCAFFRPLSGRLGIDQPMYGLGQPTGQLDTTGPTDVADVAAAYATEINAVAPTGPISLAAISLGGVVAYELAQQLIDQGRDVALLALFDAYGPAAEGLVPSLEQRVASTARRAVTTPKRYWTELADRQGQKLQRTAERAGLLVRQRLNMRTDHQLEIRRFIEANISSQVNYSYEPYSGAMLVIKAADHPFAELHVERRMGWSSVAAGELTITTAPGEHLSMMNEPHVQHVADAIRGALGDVASAAGHTGSLTASVPQVGRVEVERLLVAGLRLGRLGSVIGRVEQRPGLSDDAKQLVADTDRVMRGLADGTRVVADEVIGQLINAGVSARLAPVPNRLAHATASVTIAGPVDSTLEQVKAAMAGLSFLPVGSESLEGSGPHLDFVRRDASTTRMRLTWPDSTPRRAAFPSQIETVSTVARRVGDRIQTVRSSRSSGAEAANDIADDLGIYLGTPRALIGPLLEFAGVKPGDVIVDIGCGDGRVLIEAASRFGCTARGYEIDADLVKRGRQNSLDAQVEDRVEIVHGDAAKMSLDGVDIVFAFLPPEAVAKILEPALAQLPSDAVFLSHEQLAAELPIAPDRRALIVDGASGGQTGESGGITVANLWHGRRADR